MVILFFWLLGSIVTSFYLWWAWIEIFAEAYDSWNIVKFIISIICFLSIPLVSYFLLIFLFWADEENKKESKRALREERKKQKSNNLEK